MGTERLIEELVQDLVPVRRVPAPSVRLMWWGLLSLPAVALVVWLSGVRPDLVAKFSDPRFLFVEVAALVTALVSTYAALCAGSPDTPAWKVWLPLLPMALWLGALGRQCLGIDLWVGVGALQLSLDARCIPAIALGGAVPAIVTAALLWRSRGFRTGHACFCGALGAAALSAAALRLYHTADAALMVIVWELGSVALFTLVAGVTARAVLGIRQPSGARRPL
ncbi:MAG: NrsF family protein [Acetobacteraceae bacterium]